MKLRVAYGHNQQIGLGIGWDTEYKDLVFEFGAWWLAIGLKK